MSCLQERKMSCKSPPDWTTTPASLQPHKLFKTSGDIKNFFVYIYALVILECLYLYLSIFCNFSFCWSQDFRLNFRCVYRSVCIITIKIFWFWWRKKWLFIVFQWNRIIMKSYIEISRYTFTLSKVITTSTFPLKCPRKCGVKYFEGTPNVIAVLFSLHHAPNNQPVQHTGAHSPWFHT